MLAAARQRGAAGAKSLVSKRSYAHAANPAWATTQAAGIKVAAADDGAPTAAITVIAKAGSRYETSPGVAHALKAYAFKNTGARSAFRTARETELLGGSLTASTTRENLILTAEFLKEDLPYFVEVLGDVVTDTQYTKHQYVEEVVPQIASEYQQAQTQPEMLAADVAHSLAFRTGLGNSLFASPLHPVDVTAIEAYAQNAFSKSNIAVLGSGVSSEELSSLVSEHFGSAPTGSALTTSPSKYFGGESRIETDLKGSGVFFLALPGGKVASAHTLLRYVLGGESYLKWAPGASPLSAIQAGSAKVQAVHMPYSDTGLFGVLVSGEASQVREAATKAVSALKDVASKGVKDDEAKRAVAKAKFAVAQLLDSSRAGALETVGSEILADGRFTSLEEIFSQLDKIKASDITEAAKSALKAKPTTVAVGDVRALPYVDELGL